ncbi:uncharacterized protein LOC103837732 isoform X1 [Brassica rapa]|uniref:uncharacterized protein LOC103837732 isoform X1 n=1 Tax=Brassica campestris TaxID=3711 RepID=UPI00142E43FE|nr:uncharacterized protein LOC103837732 isoform X1 [Brassica rapa]
MSINISFWNVRGINGKDKHPDFLNWRNVNKVSFGAILESHVKESNLSIVMNAICPGWSFASNHSEDEDGRIIIFWKHPLQVSVLLKTRQSLTCFVHCPGSPPFTVTAVYAANTSDERQQLWKDLRDTQTTCSLHQSSWIIGGDFNEIIHCAEHSSVSFTQTTPQMIEFKECLDDIEVKDLRYHGPCFTWSNKQPEDPIAKKLDRIMVNEHWIQDFPLCQAAYLAPLISDHSPGLVNLNCVLPSAGSKAFKFFNYLVTHPDFQETVTSGWEFTSSDSWNLSSLSKKQKQLKKYLKSLNKDNFSDIQKRVSEATLQLENLQLHSLMHPSESAFLAERTCTDKVAFLKTIEESFFHQKSRIKWLKLGDQNSAFFHKVATARNFYNAIHTLMDHNGVVASTPESVGILAVNHFRSILGPPLAPVTPNLLAYVQQFTVFSCTEDQKLSLSKIPAADEVMRTLFKLNPNKSPGPDGLTSRFYSAAWLLVGAEVTTSIIKFFELQDLPTATNSTILTLLPKFPGATEIKDYRPISCCNTLYKVISKILVGKLKPLLSSIILPNQSAFIKGRQLLENCLLASEIVSGDHKNKGHKRLTIKVDIAKAFDSVKWDFILSCLESLNLPTIFLNWVKECLSTTAFSVGINGSLHGYFRGTRGLRQGDPLSPYLFGLAMNVLSNMLNTAASDGIIGYHPRCKDSALTHLCFADDLLIFSDGSPSSVQGILRVLSDFQFLSGLAISPQKSCFFPAALSTSEVDLISSSSGIPQGSLPVRYLGLPLNTKKLSLLNCEPLLQKIKSKINSWTTKYLSFAGRLQLLSSTISGIINFWCNAFILPSQCIKKINSMCAAFLWKGSVEGRYTARVAWEKVCLPKDEGGLGLKNLCVWNKACSLKLLWMLFFQTESVWVAWIHQNVIKDSDFWLLKEKQSHTWIFKKILRLRHLAVRWLKILPGNGRECRFWTSPWSPFGQLINFVGQSGPRSTGIPISSSLASLWSNDSWTLAPARSDRMEEVLTYLTSISLSDRPDTMIWNTSTTRSNQSRCFSANQVYNLIRESNPSVAWKNVVWLKRGIPKFKTLTWLFVLDRCPTRNRLLAWGLQTDAGCLLCNRYQESRDHLFFDCEYSYAIWGSLATRLNFSLQSNSWNDSLQALIDFTGDSTLRYLIILAWQASIYEIWKERNNRLHRNIFRSPSSLVSSINATVKNRISSFRDDNGVFSSQTMQRWLSTN